MLMRGQRQKLGWVVEHTPQEATKEWQVVQRRRKSYWGYLLVFIDG